MQKFLQLKRLEVHAKGERIYNQVFNKGLNVIAGKNGTGKSTIIDFIAYVLGYEEIKWKAVQKKCDYVIGTFSIDDSKKIILKREINDKRMNPIYCKTDINDLSWTVLTYKNSEGKRSFSSFLFEFFGIPLTKLEQNSSLTMFHILRLLYADQSSPADSLLNRQKEFDNKGIRKSLSELLLGIDDLESHNIRQQISELEKKYNSDNAEIKSIQRFLEDWGLHSPEEIQSKIAELEKVIKNAEVKIAEKDSSLGHNSVDYELRKDIKKIDLELGQVKNEIEKLTSEILDSHELIALLENSSNEINESLSFYSIFSGLEFLYCPQCLQPLQKNESKALCTLCNGENEEVKTIEKFYLDRKIELEFQVAESKKIITKRKKEIQKLEATIGNLNLKRTSQAKKVTLQEKLNNLEIQLITEASIQVGESYEKINQLKLNESRVKTLEKMIASAKKVKGQIVSFRDDLDRLTESRIRYRSIIFNSIGATIKNLLEKDGGYETTFQNPVNIELDFENSEMKVDGTTKFSDSSDAVLKVASRFSVFLSSLKHEKVRIPKFSIIDCMEDKGMLPERAALIQNGILDELDNVNVDYQLIIGTSMPCERLLNDDYIVNKFYEKGEHTLDISL